MNYFDWYLKIISRKIWLIILTFVVFTGISAYVTFNFITPIYKANVSLFVLITDNQNDQTSSTITYDELMAGQVLVKNYIEILKGRAVTSEVIRSLNLKGVTDDSLSKDITVELVPDSSVINIQVENEDPNMAKSIANKLCDIFIKKSSEMLNFKNVSIVDSATVSSNPVSSRPVVKIGLGGLIGIILSVFFILISEFLNDTVESLEEIERRLGIPVIGVLPKLEIK